MKNEWRRLPRPEDIPITESEETEEETEGDGD
jgi:hypothetical protein